MAALDGDGNYEFLSAALRDAASDLEQLLGTHRGLVNEFEGHGWTGMDGLDGAGTHVGAVVDNLTLAAERIGVGGQIVRDALTSNHMITRASKASLGHG